MSDRTIASTGRSASREIRDVVQAALIAEPTNPSTRIWLASAWVTDAVVVENSGGEFCTFVPEWPERGIRLAEVLAQLAMAGSKVTVITNSDERNATFKRALRARVGHLGEVESYTMPELHRKRLVTECVELKGSMNFTHFGLNRNAEDLVMDTSPEGVAGAINDMEEMVAGLRVGTTMTAPKTAIDSAELVESQCGINGVARMVSSRWAAPLNAGSVIFAAAMVDDWVLWVLQAADLRTSEELLDFVTGFVWPSYAWRRNPSAHVAECGHLGLPTVDGVDPIVLGSTMAGAQACIESIEAMLRVHRLRPATAVATPRHIAAVLRDLEDALARNDPVTSRLMAQEARASGRLRLRDQALIEVRLLSVERRHDELVQFAKDRFLASMSLPRAVEDALLDSAFRVLLKPALDEQGVEAALDAFRVEVAPILGEAFRNLMAARSPGARAAWAVKLAAQGAVAPAAQDVLLEGAASDDERTLISRILEGRVLAESDDGVRIARSLMATGDDAIAFEVLARAAPLLGGEEQPLLAEAARRIEDPEYASRARRGLVAAGAEVDEAGIGALSTRDQVVGWKDWLEAVVDNPDWDLGDAEDAIAARPASWASDLRRGGLGLATAVADLVETTAGTLALRAAIPEIVRDAIPQDGPERDDQLRSLAPVLVSLAAAIASDDAVGLADLNALIDIHAACQDGGIGAADHDALHAAMLSAWDRAGNPPRFYGWVLNACSVLADEGSGDEALRERVIGGLVTPLASDLGRSSHVIPPEVWTELREVLQRVGLSGLVPAEAESNSADDDDAFAHLKGKVVLLHSLIEAAARRAREHIEAHVPGVRVIVDASLVGGPSLEQQAHGADEVVIAHRAAAHAATDFIRRNFRGQVRWAAGTGWSSMVDALRYDHRPN